jgi:hypothetical protein
VDEEQAARLREEARILFKIRNAALERVEAGNERALPMLKAVNDLVVERGLESEAALLGSRSVEWPPAP